MRKILTWAFFVVLLGSSLSFVRTTSAATLDDVLIEVRALKNDVSIIKSSLKIPSLVVANVSDGTAPCLSTIANTDCKTKPPIPVPMPPVPMPPINSDGESGSDQSSVDFNAPLGLGVKNDQVKRLQDYLKQKGYFSDDSTGYFGKLTEEAVRKLQAENGIDSTGTVGPKTRKHLNMMFQKMPGCLPTPTTKSTDGVVSSTDTRPCPIDPKPEPKPLPKTCVNDQKFDFLTGRPCASANIPQSIDCFDGYRFSPSTGMLCPKKDMY